MDKKGILLGYPIDIIAGVTIFISGIVIIFGYINLGGSYSDCRAFN